MHRVPNVDIEIFTSITYSSANFFHYNVLLKGTTTWNNWFIRLSNHVINLTESTWLYLITPINISLLLNICYIFCVLVQELSSVQMSLSWTSPKRNLNKQVVSILSLLSDLPSHIHLMLLSYSKSSFDAFNITMFLK